MFPHSLLELFFDELEHVMLEVFGFGTLYTAVYWPLRGEMELRWPAATWRQSFANFQEGTHTIRYVDGTTDTGTRARHPN